MRALPVLVAVLAGCASAPAGPPPPPPELAFRDVKAVAIVHRVAWRGEQPAPGEVRRRDPLDALESELAGRGVQTVTLELAERPPAELAAVDRLARYVEAVVQGASPDGRGIAVASAGAQAGPVLAPLGADALAVHGRGPGFGAPPSAPFFGPPLAVRPPIPVSWIAVVARDGTILAFTWGGDPLAAQGAGNAAEAVDAVLGLLIPPPPE